MKKPKQLLLVLALLISLSSLLLLNAKADVKNGKIQIEKPDSIRAIYLTAHTVSSKRFPDIIMQLQESGGNAVVIDIEHGGGKLAFEPKNEFVKLVNPGSKTLNNLKEIVNYLHNKGVYVIARQVIFNDPYASAKRPEWRIKYKWGGTYDYRWLDPSRPSVQNESSIIKSTT